MLSFLGVSIGVGNIFGNLITGIARNFHHRDFLVR
jgi:F0F1-type ATP synthase membrane subunit c/vacuolar-type H+-ATPase subunit K